MREFLRFLLLLLLILAVIAVGVAYYLVHLASAPIQPQRGERGERGEPVAVVFEVAPGETTAQIAENLASDGLIRYPLIFQLYARFRGLDSQLEAGRYTLSSDMSIDDILIALTHAPGEVEVNFVLREGLRLEQVALALEQQGIASADDVTAALQQPYDFDFLADRPEGTSLEGYIFPDTYSVPISYDAEQVIAHILGNFGRRFTPAMRNQAKERGLTVYEVLALAAIVEREAIRDEERPMIASVFLNRLGVGMPLDADPTVQYALGYNESQGRWWPHIYFDEIGVSRLSEFDHPYNTYRHAGLPPGPICSPGLAAIVAVLEPAQTEYYYFVAKGDGSGEHAFARTLEEHNANVARYQP